MAYRWEYLRCQVTSFKNHTTFNDQVVSCSSRTFQNKADCIYNAIQQGGQYRLDVQVILCIIKEQDDLQSTSTLSNYSARLATFRKWPPAIPITPHAMALAGFFYQGIGDRVTCYSCGKSLISWKATDNPWSEHQRHSPHCAHLNGPSRSEDVTGCFNHKTTQGPAEVCDGGDLVSDHDIDMADSEN